LLTVC